MERVCFLLKVRADKVAEYRRRHEVVWAEMRQALTLAGWHNYSLFLRDDGLLVGYVETPDFKRALEQMAATEINARWQADMAPYFESLNGQRPDEGIERLEELFHLP